MRSKPIIIWSKSVNGITLLYGSCDSTENWMFRCWKTCNEEKPVEGVSEVIRVSLGHMPIAYAYHLCFWNKISYRLEFPRTPPWTSDTGLKSRLLPVLLSNWLQIRGYQDPLLRFELFARAVHKTQRNMLLTKSPVYCKRI